MAATPSPAPSTTSRVLQRYREQAVKALPTAVGVYALCDLDNVPIYVGQSKDGIRQRVQRHLTSARSDVIANRQLDVWEVAYVWAWPMPGASPAEITAVETYLICQFHAQKPLLNGTIPVAPLSTPSVPEVVRVSVLPEAEIELRRDPVRRLPRQADQFRALVAHILEVKDNVELRRTLAAHFERLAEYYERFLEPGGTTRTEAATGPTNEQE